MWVTGKGRIITDWTVLAMHVTSGIIWVAALWFRDCAFDAEKKKNEKHTHDVLESECHML